MSWPDPRRLRWTPTLRVPSDDGTEIAVEILGDGHPGPTLVFVHGWTLSSRSWHYQRMLAERHRLVLMDHRDHGESGLGPREHRTIEQVGRDLYAVLQAVCSGRASGAEKGAGRASGAEKGAGRASGAEKGAGRDVVLIGHSMGGMTIMSLAGQHPELFDAQAADRPVRVTAVGLLDTSGHRPEGHTFGLRGPLAKAWLKQWSASLALMVEDPERAERARRSGSRLSVRISGWLNLGKGADRRLAEFTEALTAATPAQAVGDFWTALEAHDQREALHALGQVPTLVLCGDRDRLTPPSDSRALAAAIPGARLLELHGAGHCAMLEQPEAVNAAITDLIESTTAAGLPTPYPDATPIRQPVAR